MKYHEITISKIYSIGTFTIFGNNNGQYDLVHENGSVSYDYSDRDIEDFIKEEQWIIEEKVKDSYEII